MIIIESQNRFKPTTYSSQQLSIKVVTVSFKLIKLS